MNGSSRNLVDVLVIDDQLDGADGAGRKAVYEGCFRGLFGNLVGRWEFNVIWCRNPSELAAAKQRGGSQRLLILDMVLDENVWARSVVRQMDDWLLSLEAPSLLVSEHFNQPYAMERANSLSGNLAKNRVPCQFVLWQSIVSASKDVAVSQQLEFVISSMLSSAYGRDQLFSKSSEEPIDILHITDAHFGKAAWDAGALSMLRARFRDLRLPSADFLAVTGDVANQGLPSEYGVAVDYLESISHNGLLAPKTSELAVERVFVVPGNHDYSRVVALGANLNYDQKEKTCSILGTPSVDLSWIQLLARKPYEDFERRVTSVSKSWTPAPGFHINTRFLSAGLIFLQLDLERHPIDGYQVGASDDEIRRRLNEATRAITAIRKDGECVVVLAHRNDDSAWTALGTMLKNFFSGLGSFGAVVVFCGHEHDSRISPEYDRRVLLVRGVPPLEGVSRPVGQLCKLHHVSLVRNSGRVVGAVVNTFQQTPGEWLQSSRATEFRLDRHGEWR